jgi:hypothetical protein
MLSFAHRHRAGALNRFAALNLDRYAGDRQAVTKEKEKERPCGA